MQQFTVSTEKVGKDYYHFRDGKLIAVGNVQLYRYLYARKGTLEVRGVHSFRNMIGCVLRRDYREFMARHLFEFMGKDTDSRGFLAEKAHIAQAEHSKFPAALTQSWSGNTKIKTGEFHGRVSS